MSVFDTQYLGGAGVFDSQAPTEVIVPAQATTTSGGVVFDTQYLGSAGIFDSQALAESTAQVVSMGMFGAGNARETRAFADLLDKARPTKAAKKRLRRVLEDEALELLPDEPEALKVASIIAQVVAKKEIQAIERRPADAAPLVSLPFDPHEEVQRMVNEWLQNEAIRAELEAEDENDIEMLLLG